MKKEKKVTAVQGVAKQSKNKSVTGDINVTKVSNCLVALMQPETDASQLFQLGGLSVSTWLSNATHGAVACNLSSGAIILQNTSSKVSTTLPKEIIDGNDAVVRINAALCYLLGVPLKSESAMEVPMQVTDGAQTESNVKEPTAKKNSMSKSELKEVAEKANKLFATEKEAILTKMVSAKEAKQKRQILTAQLMSIFIRCGFRESKKKQRMLALLNEDNLKSFNDLYGLAA